MRSFFVLGLYSLPLLGCEFVILVYNEKKVKKIYRIRSCLEMLNFAVICFLQPLKPYYLDFERVFKLKILFSLTIKPCLNLIMVVWQAKVHRCFPVVQLANTTVPT